MFDPSSASGATGSQSCESSDLSGERLQASCILALAQKKARFLMEKTEKEAEVIKQEAYNQGFAQGVEQGKVKGQELGYMDVVNKGQAMLSELDNINVEYQNSVTNLLGSLEDRIMNLVSVTVRSILRKEIDEDRESVLGIIRSAGEKLLERDMAKLLVNRNDMELVLAKKDELVAGIDNIIDIEVIPGSTVDPGGCILETGSGMIDARVNTQLEAFDELYGAV
ncbi:MAG: hypothetical protein LWY06_08860 [Firmicutes bacterium]|nr:hypothetical protein [Bacillota bacterium]